MYQRKLLTDEALTFQCAVDISMSMEAVASDSKHLKTSLRVHAVSFSPPQGGEKCFRCGKTNHNEKDLLQRAAVPQLQKERPYCPFVQK